MIFVFYFCRNENEKVKQLEANLTQHKTALTQERARVQSLIEILKKAKDKHDEVSSKK